jgi:L-asparaginase II
MVFDIVPCRAPLAAVVTRGGGVEAWHSAAVAVVGGGGQLAFRFGDADLRVPTRSTIKPFQALPLLLSGAAVRFGLSAEELAIAAGSHSGADAHVAVVRRLLDKCGAKPEALLCGAHWPLGLRLSNRYPERGQDRDPLRNNCSGKHAGFLAVARELGAADAQYLDPDGPVQSAVRDAVAKACEVDATELVRGIDGCSAPNYGMPLAALARGFLNLAVARAEAGGFEAALAQMRSAMLAHPLLVSGEGRFDYDVTRHFSDRLVCKGGAEGLQAIGVTDPPFGIAIKVLDGQARALGPICIAVLAELGLFSAGVPASLEHYARPRVRNLRNLVTGEIIARVELEPVP